LGDIGISVKSPKERCNDSDCPFHGRLSVRGRIFQGLVVSDNMMKTITIRRNYLHYVPKYKRYERRHSCITAHNPPCIDAKNGDKVKIAECRPLNKTTSFVVIEKVS